ncbi:MAG: ATP-binding protein [Polyangiaceae bacterium]|nr:ATP-binding protein [Polyangiaceae bacterium]
MRALAVLSGKGGTGKTSVTAALAALLAPIVTVDCDVDAANLGLLLPGPDDPGEPAVVGLSARVQPDLCNGCLRCTEVCRFNSVRMVDGRAEIDVARCEGCTACAISCPVAAIELTTRVAGQSWIRSTAYGPLVHAELDVGRDNSGHVVALLLNRARQLTKESTNDLALLDGPPGIGCPVHATLSGANAVLLVAEASRFGVHDVERALEVSRSFTQRIGLVVNRADLWPEGACQLERLTVNSGIELVAQLPFDRRVPDLLAQGRLLLELDGAMRNGLERAAEWTREVLRAERGAA